MVTLGSDAHRPEHVGYGFSQVRELLLACGYKYYTEFRRGKPVFTTNMTAFPGDSEK